MKKYIQISMLFSLSIWVITCGGDDDEGLLFFLPGDGAEEVTDTTTPVGTTATDEEGTPEFNFQTSRDITIEVTVKDQNGVLQGAVIQVLAGEEKLYQSVTQANGMVDGSFNLIDAYEVIALQILVGGQKIVQLIQTEGLLGIHRTIEIQTTVAGDNGNDLDGDGIPDDEDAYPEDPTRASIITTPSTGQLVVAFEDLYPNPGDADFNDYVVIVRNNEEDLNASGQVVAMRATYEHIGAGAGYKNKLMLNVPGNLAGNVKITVTEPNGNTKVSVENHSADLQTIDIFPGLHSKHTLYGNWNSNVGESITQGMTSQLEIEFDEPVERSVIGSAPYDLYLSILKYGNTEVVQVHFPGLYTNESGQDQYIDSNGFPWAVQIPLEWNWPLSRQNIHSAYPQFKNWYESGLEGQPAALDWYKYPAENLNFRFFNIGGTGLEAFLGGSRAGMHVLIAMAVLAILSLFGIRIYRRQRGVASDGS